MLNAQEFVIAGIIVETRRRLLNVETLRGLPNFKLEVYAKELEKRLATLQAKSISSDHHTA